MTAEAASARPPDPDLNMGLRLIAVLRRASAGHAFRVGVVWVTLVGILSLVLLQINVDPGYLLRRSDILRLIVVNGLGVTIAISLVSVAIASVLALIGALGRLSPHPVAQGLAGFYVSVVRGTPLLIQLFLIYNGLAQIGTQLIRMGYPDLGNLLILKEIPAGVLALSLNYGAYMTEIFRAGIQSVGRGQWQAASALGMSNWQTLRLVVLPQAFRTVFPAIVNQFIAMQKDSSLVSVMGIWEITFRANRFARKDSKYMEMFLLAAAIYWILTVISEWIQGRIEARFAEADRR